MVFSVMHVSIIRTSALDVRLWKGSHTGCNMWRIEIVCDIYECCKKSKKLKHCGHCHELPCILYEAQDPTKSEEDNQKDFLMQMKNLTEAQ